MNRLLSKNKKYSKLITDLKRILGQGKKAALNITSQIVVQAYWKMGKRIHKEKAAEQTTLRQLAHDLEMEESLVYRIVKFYQRWPKICPTGQTGQILSWAHYKELLAIEDRGKRNFYLDKASKHNWNRDQLVQKIKDDYYRHQNSTESKKKPEATLEREKDKMHLYSAIVEKVVDGDTLLLRIDLGFNVWINQRIRLRGIDCPEVSTPQGQRAKKFVQQELSDCIVVVIQTFKRIDLHGRYVVDVFYLKDETAKEFIVVKGNFLNQRLLDEDLAVLL